MWRGSHLEFFAQVTKKSMSLVARRVENGEAFSIGWNPGYLLSDGNPVFGRPDRRVDDAFLIHRWRLSGLLAPGVHTPLLYRLD